MARISYARSFCHQEGGSTGRHLQKATVPAATTLPPPRLPTMDQHVLFEYIGKGALSILPGSQFIFPAQLISGKNRMEFTKYKSLNIASQNRFVLVHIPRTQAAAASPSTLPLLGDCMSIGCLEIDVYNSWCHKKKGCLTQKVESSG